MILILLLLLLVLPAGAQELKLTSPALPCWVQPGETVDLEVSGPPGRSLSLDVPDGPRLQLVESSPGVYQACFNPHATCSLILHDGNELVGPLLTVEVLGMTPPVARVAHDHSIFRCGPHPDFDRYDPLEAGVEFSVTGRRGDWLRMHSPPLAGWINIADVTLKEPGQPASRPRVAAIRITETADGAAELRLRLDAPCGLQVREQPDLSRLHLIFPAARMAMFETAYAQDSKRVPAVRLVPFGEHTEAEVEVSEGLWGYTARWEAPELVLRLAPPVRKNTLAGLRVVLDPGHGGKDLGAPGVYGLLEKDLNLRVSLALKRELEAAGAVVTMTRDNDREVASAGSNSERELASRVDLAEAAQGQLFISIHHNAKADVGAARRARGTHIYYYRPQSRKLAQSLAAPLARAIGEKSYMHLWRSFHVIRQTAMPAVLVECNFISNPALEKEVLSNPQYPARAARGLREGLEAFLQSTVEMSPNR